jgi:hypothetical protein
VTTAFHGDHALKAEVLARLRAHAAAGTLVFGATRWDGRSGTPMGVSVRSENSADYAERLGYPLALAAILDRVTACVAPDRAIGYALEWVEAVEPGTDLSAVSWRIADALLVLLKADRLAAPHYRRLRDMHARHTAKPSVSRAEWANLRDIIETDGKRRRSEAVIAVDACAAACWPLDTSRSVLIELIDRWRRAPAKLPNPNFTDAERRRAGAVLEELWAETMAARDAGEAVHIPTLFRARAPRLAALFEADLERGNTLFRIRSEAVPPLVLRHLAEAARASDVSPP